MADLPDAFEASSEGTAFAVSTAAQSDGVTTVAVSGEIDLLTAPRVGAAVEAAQGDAGMVLLDLRDVSFLGSAGLSVLVDAARRAGDTGTRFAVWVTSHVVRRAIEVTGLDTAFTLVESQAQATEYFAS